MTSHAESARHADTSAPAAPKLHLSKDNATIRFSAVAKEDEEEEEELYATVATANPPWDPGVLTGVEAGEEMDASGVSRLVLDSSRLSSGSRPAGRGTATPTLSSYLSEQKAAGANAPPTKSLSFPSVKTLSSDVESRDSVSSAPAPTPRHQQLMKSLVKSLSSDSSQDPAASSSSLSSYRLSESRLNLQLFKQFTQPRVQPANDSKTLAPSPQTSPDNRSFFKVSEVEARIEDTKRRLSEAISEPLQLLSKIIDEKSSGSVHRTKVLSASAQELSSAAATSVNGLLESNNNYCIKEEEGGGDAEARSPDGESLAGPPTDAKSPNKSFSVPASLDNFSMSALAKLEDEDDFCILDSDDFKSCADADWSDSTATGSHTKASPSGASEPWSEDESESVPPDPGVPYYTLCTLSTLVYLVFVLPLPTYVAGLVLGIGLGFLTAIGAVWLTGPKPSGGDFRHSRHQRALQNQTKLDIKEPDIYKGWMNEILNYDPETYHATLTHSVFVRLEAATIRLSKPNHNIARRAVHNEPKPDVTYVSQKIYDLTGSRVYLAPPSLARKRTWNKKYPICIQLAKQDDFMSKAEGDRCDAGDDEGAPSDRAPPASAYRAELTLFLFGRTGREKEEWFHRFLSASRPKADVRTGTTVGAARRVTAPSGHSRSSSGCSLDEVLASPSRSKDSSSSSSGTRNRVLLDYSVYMGSLLPKEAEIGPAVFSPILLSPQSPPSGPGADAKVLSAVSAPEEAESQGAEEESVAWLNAALGRIFWDFLNEPYWAQVVSKKIQLKLSKIRLPYFMNELTLTELDMGSQTPRILGASKPSVNCRGLWFDLDVSYSGSFLMTLETKMNLIRLGKEAERLRLGELGKDGHRPRTFCLADSDEESSSAGSSDEEDSSDPSSDAAAGEGLVGGHKPSKILRLVDKIAKSRYFQKATETEFIKKKMEEVSNTPLLLSVELQRLQGTLAVNIPPPPTDRIWYGFRTPPHLELKARPKLGEREVTLAHVTDWIEKKLDQEFQKILVMPNMDDVWLSLMHAALDPRSAAAGPLVDPPSDAPTDPPSGPPSGPPTGDLEVD
ncbi:unnamed protein product [Ophioblennius macclurei]